MYRYDLGYFISEEPFSDDELEDLVADVEWWCAINAGAAAGGVQAVDADGCPLTVTGWRALLWRLGTRLQYAAVTIGR